MTRLRPNLCYYPIIRPETKRKCENPSVRFISVSAEIRTVHLPNANHKRLSFELTVLLSGFCTVE
jgi:hypothetical protein